MCTLLCKTGDDGVGVVLHVYFHIWETKQNQKKHASEIREHADAEMQMKTMHD